MCSTTTIEQFNKLAAEAALVLLLSLAFEIDSDSGPDDSDSDNYVSISVRALINIMTIYHSCTDDISSIQWPKKATRKRRYR